MRLQTWKSINTNIENKKWAIKAKRGMSRSGTSDGIAVMNDPLALEYQRLTRIQKHVGCHSFSQYNREHGMKGVCFYARKYR